MATYEDEESVRRFLSQAQRLLLDLSLRNRLLNYRPSRDRGLDPVVVDIDAIFRALVVDGRPVGFEGVPEPDERQQRQATVSAEDVAVSEGVQRALWEAAAADSLGQHSSSVEPRQFLLRTTLPDSSLTRRLDRIRRDAITLREETGVNTLFLALGMLEWYEPDWPTEARYAPLILVPVDLSFGRAGKIHMKHDGSDVASNVSLAAKLEEEYGLQLPDISEQLQGEHCNVKNLLDDVQAAIASQHRWRVHPDRVVLGFFNYLKYMMYKDLQGDAWPDNRKPWHHDGIRKLVTGDFDLGDYNFSEDEHLDRVRRVAESFEVFDADSSQVLALLQAQTGTPMIIEGPPGTGKSQTIANLIAHALAARKSVLFVSEKMAALQVVKRRLEVVGLGDACLELHSSKTSKVHFYECLRKTVNQAPVKALESQLEIERLEELRNSLNCYCEAINRPLEHRGVSPRDAMADLVAIGTLPPDIPRLPSGMMKDWTREDWKRNRPIVLALEEKIRQIGRPSEHVFWGVRLASTLPHQRQALGGLLESAISFLEELLSVADTLSERLRGPRVEGIGDIEMLCRSAIRVAQSPPLWGASVGSEKWLSEEKRIRRTLSDGVKLRSITERRKGQLLPDAWTVDVRGVKHVFSRRGGSWLGRLHRDFRRARRAIKALCASQSPLSIAQQEELLDDILEYQAYREALLAHDAEFRELFGAQWQGEQSDWVSLSETMTWILGLWSDVRSRFVFDNLPMLLSEELDRTGLEEQATRLKALVDDYATCLRSVLEMLDYHEQAKPFQNETLPNQLARLRTWRGSLDELEGLTQYNRLVQEASSAGLQEVARVAAFQRGAQEWLCKLFDYTWSTLVLEEALRERPALEGFDPEPHEKMIAEFREKDRLLQRLNRQRVAYAHFSGVPVGGVAGKVGWLREQYNKSRRHRPIREAMSKAGDAVVAIKPVFMMSPLSIAMYLPADGPTFDMVIFDEASQIRPEEAIGAILRARQMIVVGDTKQMPPTSFFEKVISDEAEEGDSDSTVIRDVDSILSLMKSKIEERSPQRRRLLWHYRSVHDSLIRTSNRLYYDDELVVFPHPQDRASDLSQHQLGLYYHHLPHTSYDRGGTRRNDAEARAVAERVLQHIVEEPEHSLGVAAFSLSQQQAIEDALDGIAGARELICEFDQRHESEPLFLKNLENVQGDERDVVFISVGYGKDTNGYVAMNFGPLNQEGGERRLNVLITRARYRCEVFTNLLPEDIRVDAGSSLGLKHLRTFLQYAKTGNLDRPEPSGRPPESPLEVAVKRALEVEGYTVHSQVGSIGFFIDLAVVHPDAPDRYILGIECDGAMYHSAKSARDRDRLRQEALEARGWRIHRIWGPAWYQNPARELARCKRELELALEIERAGRGSNEEPTPDPGASTEIERLSGDRRLPQQGEPYIVTQLRITIRPGFELYEEDPRLFGQWIAEVVRTELVVHFDELVRRIREAAGVQRAGTRIRDAVRNGIRLAVYSRQAETDGDFVCAPGWQERIVPRSRADFPPQYKRLEYVHSLEIRAAVLRVVQTSFGVRWEECARAALTLLGFQRTTGEMTGRVEEVIRDSLRKSILVFSDDHLRLP